MRRPPRCESGCSAGFGAVEESRPGCGAPAGRWCAASVLGGGLLQALDGLGELDVVAVGDERTKEGCAVGFRRDLGEQLGDGFGVGGVAGQSRGCAAGRGSRKSKVCSCLTEARLRGSSPSPVATSPPMMARADSCAWLARNRERCRAARSGAHRRRRCRPAPCLRARTVAAARFLRRPSAGRVLPFRSATGAGVRG